MRDDDGPNSQPFAQFANFSNAPPTAVFLRAITANELPLLNVMVRHEGIKNT